MRVVSLAERGRGRALKQVWQNSPADILAYMDVDLSTSLDDFLPMIQPLVAGEAGVAIGSRLAKGTKTTRGLKREFISRCYNKIIKWTSGTKFSDAQCGFKAIRRDIAAKFLPKIKDNEWFFDTELLIKTERAGVPIYEQPVTTECVGGSWFGVAGVRSSETAVWARECSNCWVGAGVHAGGSTDVWL